MNITDMQFRFSGDGTPAGSLGGAMHANSITNAQDGNLFANVTSDQAQAGAVHFRCFYVRATANHTNVRMYMESQGTPNNDSNVYLALGAAGKNGTEQTIADEETSPLNVIFVFPDDLYNPIELGNMNSGDYWPIWVQRKIEAGAAGYDSDYVRLKFVGDS